MAMTLSLTLTANGETIEGESTIASSDREDTIECFSFSYKACAVRVTKV